MSRRKDNIIIGAELEEYVAGRLRTLGIDPTAKRNPDSGSGNREKADIETNLQILGQNVHIECKNWARHGMASWLEHTQHASSMTHGLPILIYKLRRDSLHQARAIIDLETFLELIKKSYGVVVNRVVDVDSKNARYFSGKLNTATQKLIKLSSEQKPNPRLLQYARQELKAAAKGLEQALKQDYGN